MRQSNAYILIFTAAMTIVVGGLLSLASQALAPAQKKSIELDTKSAILASVMDLESMQLKPDEVLSLYNERIESLVVDINGEPIETDEKGNPIVAENVNILKNYKKDPADRQYPVFKYMDEAVAGKVDSYILPVYGAGLWDKIWGYVAMDNSFQEIVGVSYGHKQETPGLGARISTPEIQDRYKGKKIFDESGELVSVTMLKGEGNDGLNEHQVDGMSGATLTGRGVNAMLEKYFSYYQAYMEKAADSGSLTTASR